MDDIHILTINPGEFTTNRNHIVMLAEEFFGKEVVVAGAADMEFETELSFEFKDESEMQDFLITLVKNFKKPEL